jgi:hypothetical protein
MKNSTGWPSEADRTDRPAGPDNAASVDVSCWDEATIQEIDAMQRKLPLAGPPINGNGRRDGTAAVPSEAESQRSSALGHLLPPDLVTRWSYCPGLRPIAPETCGTFRA